jgi:nucleotide-binding universal stress UspA family protein
MYHKILAPLDGSKRAEAILPHLEEFAHRYHARVVFLQVIESSPIAAGIEAARLVKETIQVWEKEAAVYLDSLKGEFREKEIEASTAVAHGPIVEAIITAAERENADLIAIASHGRTGLSRVFYGSVAAGILHRADRPLLLIRSI